MKVILFIFIALSTQASWSQTSQVNTELPKLRSFTKTFSYIPEKQQYELELGSMWEKSNLYWLGGNVGFHIGRCMFSQSQTCQQYADVIFGAGGRDGLTNGVLLPSLRWQFIDVKDRFVPHARLMVGVMNISDKDRDKSTFSYGIGYGWTTAVHERLDLKFEIRAGYADQLWSQSFLSFSFKFDKWVDYFAKKLEGLGIAGKVIKGAAGITGRIIKGTVETTGKVIQGTVGATGKVIEKSGSAAGKIYDKTKETLTPNKK